MTRRLSLVLAALMAAFPAHGVQTKRTTYGRARTPVINRTAPPLLPPRKLDLDVKTLKLSPQLNDPALTLAPPVPYAGLQVGAQFQPGERRVFSPQERYDGVPDPAFRQLQDFAPPADDGTLERDAGRVLFDNAKDAAGLPDELPKLPKKGDEVRIKGVTYVLGEAFRDGGGMVFRSRSHPGVVIKFSADEVKGLLRLSETTVAHGRLLAASADGKVVAKEHVHGQTAKDILARSGSLSAEQKDALAAFAADVLRSGSSGDFNRGNLVWDAPRRRWVLIDAEHFRSMTPAQSLASMLFGLGPGNYPGVDQAAFLADLRRHLGASSELWKELAALSGTYGLEKVFAALNRPEEPPAGDDDYPPRPKPGDEVRIGGKTYVLGKKVAGGNHGDVFRVEGAPGLAIKFPNHEMSRNPEEVDNLRRLARGGIEHGKLIAASADGKVLVKEFVAGETALDIAERGKMSLEQTIALADLAVTMIRAGLAADFKPENYVWQAVPGRWVLIDAGMLYNDLPWKILENMMEGQLADHRHVDQIQFLAFVRAGLGEPSALWKNVLAGESKTYYLYEPLAELLAREDDQLPELPQEGNTVRVSGVDYVLGEPFDTGSSMVFRVKGRPDLVIKIHRHNGKESGELKGLELLGGTGIPHTRLVGRSLDGRVVVKQFAPGPTAAALGALDETQTAALVALAAALVRAGISGDLNSGNLVWDAEGARWVVIDAGELDRALPWQAFDRLFSPGQFTGEKGFDKDGLLLALKDELAREPELWKKIEAGRASSARLASLLDKLDERSIP